MQTRRGFTLIELLVGIALIAIILGLAAPSFREYITVQRLKGTSAQMVTDLQFARSEAMSRSRPVFVAFRLPAFGAPMSCYTIYTDTNAPTWDVVGAGLGMCDCTRAPGSRCETSATELRTVQILPETEITMSVNLRPNMAYDPATGGTVAWVPDAFNPVVQAFIITSTLDTTRRIATVVAPSGRPQNCLPSGASVTGGYPPCS